MRPVSTAKALHADVMHRLRWRRTPVVRITRAYARSRGLTVDDGPFAGMRFPRFALGRAESLVPKLLGSYERELHSAFQAAIRRQPAVIVDVGASDGYYAVGLARACPAATVYAYEMNPFPARVCRRLAVENGVERRVVMRGECRLEDLRGFPAEPPALVVSDCEGVERELIDPDAVPLLRRSSLVVEMHEHLAPGVEEAIRGRFAGTHHIELVESEPRYSQDYPALAQVLGVSFMDRELGVMEFRPGPARWAVLEPHDG
jgi:predicted O-methyltransferase YrrM